MSVQRKLNALLFELQTAQSPLAQAKILARSWRTLRELSPTDRRLLARHAGFDGAEQILEGLAKKRPGFAPATLLQMIEQSQDHRRRDGGRHAGRRSAIRSRSEEAITRGAGLVSEDLGEDDDGTVRRRSSRLSTNCTRWSRSSGKPPKRRWPRSPQLAMENASATENLHKRRPQAPRPERRGGARHHGSPRKRRALADAAPRPRSPRPRRPKASAEVTDPREGTGADGAGRMGPTRRNAGQRRDCSSKPAGGREPTSDDTGAFAYSTPRRYSGLSAPSRPPFHVCGCSNVKCAHFAGRVWRRSVGCWRPFRTGGSAAALWPH